jgi:DNA-binding CsgD family transcriptional regulator
MESVTSMPNQPNSCRWIEAIQVEPLSPLSKRETEVCMLLVDGRSVSSIAERLHMSEKTVYTHREHILRKLGVATVVELVQLVLFLGIPPTI